MLRCDAANGICDASLPLSRSFSDIDKKRGIEGLASSPSKTRLIAALEAPRPSTVDAKKQWLRLANLDMRAVGASSASVKEYLYPLDSIAGRSSDEGIGVSEVLFINEGELLVL